MLFRPENLVSVYLKYQEAFSMARWARLPHRIYLKWIKCPDWQLREPTAEPILFQDEMKSGFHFLEFVH